jgi:hypothetical protein
MNAVERIARISVNLRIYLSRNARAIGDTERTDIFASRKSFSDSRSHRRRLCPRLLMPPQVEGCFLPKVRVTCALSDNAFSIAIEPAL